MKSLKKLIVLAVMAFAVAIPASAQFHLGLKAGVSVNKLKFDETLIDSDNRAGFAGGIMVEFTVPVVGLGFDASVLYMQRTALIEPTVATPEIAASDQKRAYIDIPINLKWKIGIPGVNKIVTPFITTGPDFSFLCTKKNIQGALSNKSFDMGWNVGAGVELVSHLQIAASYGIGLSSSVSGENALHGANFKDGKNRCWTVTAAYIF